MQALDLARLRAELTAHVLFSMRTAVEAVGHNTLRAALTSLGILFGVASVIAMLAIGKGAEAEILEQMKLLGSNNVIVTPLVEQKEEQAKDEGTKEPKKFSPGLTMHDAAAILAVVPNVNTASSEIVLQTLVTREGRRRSGKVVGIDTTYFDILNLNVVEGKRFAPIQMADGAPVAIIGHGVKTRFFTTEEPIGKSIKVGNVWLTVVGVLEDRKVSSQTAQKLGIRDANMDVYVPLSTMLLRYRNRAQVTERDVQQASREFNEDPNATANEDTEQRAERINYHQLDRVIVRVNDAKYVTGVADVMQRMLTRRHNQVIDFEIAVPELLLKQEQNTKRLFNIVLAAIAAISLVVAGIIVGGALSFGIERHADIHTIVSFFSVFIAFGVSITVGIVFGIVPAWRAARQDPVVCL